MFRTATNRGSFRIREGSFKEAHAFVANLLARKDINKETASETLLVFEALMQKLVDWGLSESTELTITGTDRLGDFRIRIGFEGRMYAPDDEAEDSIEDRILEAHDDKLDYSYHTGYNIITISVSRSFSTSLFACAIAALCAVIAFVPLSSLMDTSGQKDLLYNYLYPLEQLYGNAALMVGAPMTFFSLLKNLTDTYIVSQRASGLRKLQLRTIATSAVAILLAFVAFSIISIAISDLGGSSSGFGGFLNQTFAEAVTSLVPPSIFEPFESISPVPLMVVALLCTYAMCSTGKYFDALRQAMMACHALFSRMLHVVLAMLPIFCFLSVMDLLLDSGFQSAIEVFVAFVALYLSILLLLVSYAVRLRAQGIKVVPFVRKLIPLLRENRKIGSAINAAPYNIRYCAKVFKMDRDMLTRNLPVLAEINLDGNCYILTLFTLVFAFLTNTNLSWLNLASLAVLIIFLSLGAPNQPGSILIGALIITMHLNSFEVVTSAILMEAFFGGLQNLINVLGDIVMVAIDDNIAKARE